MQLDKNSICGDVVLDRFNKAYRDEDNNLDLIYKSKYVQIIYMVILILITLYENAYYTKVALKPILLNSLVLCAV